MRNTCSKHKHFTCCAMVHCIVLLTDMEDAKLEVEEDSARLLTVQRHRQNATEELRDWRRQGDRERRMHGCPPAEDVRTSLPKTQLSSLYRVFHVRLSCILYICTSKQIKVNLP